MKDIFEIEFALWQMIFEATRLGTTREEVREAWSNLHHTEWEVAFTHLVSLLQSRPHEVHEVMRWLYGKFYAESSETLEEWLERTAENA